MIGGGCLLKLSCCSGKPPAIKLLRWQQQVLGLEVSHDHALPMQLHESRQDLPSVTQQLLQRQAT
jgi:hypothetical protein